VPGDRRVAGLTSGNITHNLCDMANLTLSIPDPDLARARKLAAARGTTVNAMVRGFLAREAGGISAEQQAAIEWMLKYGKARTGEIALPLPTREEVYAERLNRLP